jgi:hypothetical protein
LLKYYYENDFLDLTLTFIDGHIIAYFGKNNFQKLKHSTRNKIIKSLEVFNFSDKKGRIFYFKADHEVKGMQKMIEELLLEVKEVIGLNKLKILVFDRGGNSSELFKKLNSKFNLKFITLAVKTENIKKQIDEIVNKNNFVCLNNKDNKKYILNNLFIGKDKYRLLLIRNDEDKKIHPFITNMTKEELSNEDLLKYYSMHWFQEQEHNAFGKLGGNMHPKIMQSEDYVDKTKVNKSIFLKNKINKLKSNLVKLEQESKRINGLKISLTSTISKKAKKTDNKQIKKQINDYNNRDKLIQKEIEKINNDLEIKIKKLENIPLNPVKKKLKYGPVDYNISMVNLANNLNSKLIEIATKGKEKYQLSTLIGSFYLTQAYIYETEENIYVQYFNIRQNKNIKMIQNLCDYFNPKNIKLKNKTLIFSIF